LTTLQPRYTKKLLLRQTLLDLPGHETFTSDIEPEALTSLSLLGSAINARPPLSQSDMALLSNDRATVYDNLDTIGPAMSSLLLDQALDLASMLDPLADRDELSISDLAPNLKELHSGNGASLKKLLTIRVTCLDRLVALQALHREFLTKAITLLEHTIHGSYSRALEARSRYLYTVAESAQLKLSLMKKQAVELLHNEEGCYEALENYKLHLGTVEKDLDRREARAKKRLEEYQSLGEGWLTLRKKLEEYYNEMEVVKADLDRLQDVD
jgi:hypothetical protein